MQQQSKAMPKTACKPLEVRERQGRFPYRFQGKHGSADSLITDFFPPEFQDNAFYVIFVPPSF
jgi:hypothetical protein